MRPTKLQAHSTEKMPSLEGKGNNFFSNPDEELVFDEIIDDDAFHYQDDDVIQKHSEDMNDADVRFVDLSPLANAIRSFNDSGINRQIDAAEKENGLNYEFLLQLLHSLVDKLVRNKNRHLIMECAKNKKEVNKWKQRYYGLKGKYEQMMKKYQEEDAQIA